MFKVFLGGTCAGSKWRDELIPMLETDFFNPVVENWNEQAYITELKERETCDICLYVLTAKSNSIYSIAEVVDDSNKRPDKVVFCYLNDTEDGSFNKHELRALEKISIMIMKNGSICCIDLKAVARYINEMAA